MGSGISEPERDKTFGILVDNFSDTYKRLLIGITVARAVPNPSNIIEADISH